MPSLISDKNAKNLLYIEALNAVSLGHWEVDMETMEQLTTLRKKGQKKEVRFIHHDKMTQHYFISLCF